MRFLGWVRKNPLDDQQQINDNNGAASGREEDETMTFNTIELDAIRSALKDRREKLTLVMGEFQRMGDGDGEVMARNEIKFISDIVARIEA